MTKLQQKIGYFREMQTRLMEQERRLKNEFAKYRAEVKEAFGITDGEQANVIDIIEAMEIARALGSEAVIESKGGEPGAF